jgi:DNA-directed RNA polymerase specialized sigma24 family protein
VLREGWAFADQGVAQVDVTAHHALGRFVEVLARLRRQDRAAFVLRYVERMRLEEVASALDISAATAKRRFIRALHRVRFHAARDAFLVDYMGHDGSEKDAPWIGNRVRNTGAFV